MSVTDVVSRNNPFQIKEHTTYYYFNYKRLIQLFLAQSSQKMYLKHGGL